jgi:hypothetical protein
MFSADGRVKNSRALSNDNIFSTSGGLPYLSGMAMINDEGAQENDEMEMHIAEDIVNKLCQDNTNEIINYDDSIYNKNPLENDSIFSTSNPHTCSMFT